MMTPTPGKVIIERDAPEDKVGLLYVPDTARENATIGTVVAVNREVWWEQATAYHPLCQLGDRVLIGKWAGSEVTYEGRHLLVLSQREILAILPPATAPLGIHAKEDAGVHA